MERTIEERLLAIEERNVKVEADKAWEKSVLRRSIIIVLTYIFALVWLLSIHETNSFLKAVVPVVGYVLSTLSITIAKEYWLEKRK